MMHFCHNTNCYISDQPLTEDEAWEHIIPNALGGHLKSKHLVSTKINTVLFNKFDTELANRIEIAKLIEFVRDRGETPPIVGTNQDGHKYRTFDDKTAEIMQMKPFEIIDENGEKKLKFPLSQKDQIIAARLKKQPNLTKEDIAADIKEVTEDKVNIIDYPYGLSIIAKNNDNNNEQVLDCFRGIAKIATNFSIYNNIPKTEFLEIVEFIKCGNLGKTKLGYFYPKTLLKYEFGSAEISNILYLKGSKSESLLYCYIELFNTHCFIVILNQNYQGADLEYSHLFDLQNGVELHKPISMSLSRDNLLMRDYFYYNEVEDDYNERVYQFGKIAGLNLHLSKGTSAQQGYLQNQGRRISSQQ